MLTPRLQVLSRCLNVVVVLWIFWCYPRFYAPIFPVSLIYPFKFWSNWTAILFLPVPLLNKLVSARQLQENSERIQWFKLLETSVLLLFPHVALFEMRILHLDGNALNWTSFCVRYGLVGVYLVLYWLQHQNSFFEVGLFVGLTYLIAGTNSGLGDVVLNLSKVVCCKLYIFLTVVSVGSRMYEVADVKRPHFGIYAYVFLLLVLCASQIYNGQPCGIFRHNNQVLSGSYEILFSEDSTSGRISVVKVLDIEAIVLRCDHSLLGGYYYDSTPWTSIYKVFDMLAEIPQKSQAIDPSKANVLFIGGGVGISAMLLHQQGANVSVVEIESAVVRAAQQHLQFDIPQQNVFVEDGMEFLKKSCSLVSERAYDYIVHDVFSGGPISSHLLKSEIFQTVDKILAPNGVLAVNIFESSKNAEAIDLQHTLRQIFRFVNVYSDQDDETEFRNLVYICSNSRLDFDDKFGERVVLLEDVQQQSTLDTEIGHWKIMNEILPPEFWMYAH